MKKLYRHLGTRAEKLTLVAASAPPLPRRRVGPKHPAVSRPPEDVVAKLLHIVGGNCTAAELERLWQEAVRSEPSAGDPYQRWWTHRCAAHNLGTLLSRPIPLDEMDLREISGYAALLWPAVRAILSKQSPIALYLEAQPGEPSHLFWKPQTAYVEVCLVLYADEQGWLAALNAAVAEAESPWTTVEKSKMGSLTRAGEALSKLYITALNEVDVPVVAPRERRPHRCPTCRWWQGWDGICRWCRPVQEEHGDRRWQTLSQLLPPFPPLPRTEWEQQFHPVAQAALICLKSRYGQVPLSQALSVLGALGRSPHLADIMRKCGFSFHEAQAVIRRVQHGEKLSRALRQVLRGRGNVRRAPQDLGPPL